MDLNDPILRKGALARFSHALSLSRSLHQEMQAWWDLAPVNLALLPKDDQRTIELIMTTAPLPDVGGWYQKASDVLHGYRSALNKLAFAICFAHTTPRKPGDSNFPIHKGDEGWDGWLRKHPELPRAVADRFHDFEPFVSGRPFLAALSRADNLEKHEDGFDFAVTVTEANLSFKTTVEGLWNRDGLGDKVEFIGGSTNDLTTSSQTLATITLPTAILELSPGVAQDAAGWAVTPMLRFDGEEIPLLAAFNSLEHEVAWAISHVTGLTTDALVSPRHFNL